MSLRSPEELEADLEEILRAPKQGDTIALIVTRPDVDRREVLTTGELSPEHGLVGDSWRARSVARRPGREPDPDVQLTLMNARVAAALAPQERWPLAGDQLFVDLDLSETNLPPGTRLRAGTATLEITAVPHTGCQKFVERFGRPALDFVNSPRGRSLRLRGVYARVVEAGAVRPGDRVERLG